MLVADTASSSPHLDSWAYINSEFSSINVSSAHWISLTCIIFHLYHNFGNRIARNYIQLYSHRFDIMCDPRTALSVFFSVLFLTSEFRAHFHLSLHCDSWCSQSFLSFTTLARFFTKSLCTFSHYSLYISHHIHVLLILAKDSNETRTDKRAFVLRHYRIPFIDRDQQLIDRIVRDTCPYMNTLTNFVMYWRGGRNVRKT